MSYDDISLGGQLPRRITMAWLFFSSLPCHKMEIERKIMVVVEVGLV